MRASCSTRGERLRPADHFVDDVEFLGVVDQAAVGVDFGVDARPEPDARVDARRAREQLFRRGAPGPPRETRRWQARSDDVRMRPIGDGAAHHDRACIGSRLRCRLRASDGRRGDDRRPRAFQGGMRKPLATTRHSKEKVRGVATVRVNVAGPSCAPCSRPCASSWPAGGGALRPSRRAVRARPARSAESREHRRVDAAGAGESTHAGNARQQPAAVAAADRAPSCRASAGSARPDRRPHSAARPLPRAMREARLLSMQLGLAPLARRHRLDHRLDLAELALVDLLGDLAEHRAASRTRRAAGRAAGSSAAASAGRPGRSCPRSMRSASCSASASRSSTTCSKSLTRPTMSPMPRMRDARPSGRNASSRSRASPVPRNLIGTPVTAFTASAAPPRASPSSLVRIRPSSGEPLARRPAPRCTASRPISASHTSSVLAGAHARVDLGELLHQLVVDREAAGGVVDDRVEALACGRARRRPAQIAGAPLARGAGVHGDLDAGAELLELEHRGGAVMSAATSSTRASLALRGGARASRRRSSCRRPGARAASPRSCRARRARARCRRAPSARSARPRRSR